MTTAGERKCCEVKMENRCKFWLPKKNRFCANVPLGDSSFCGNHTERSDGQWMPCPIDPSHPVLREKLKGHLKRCPFAKRALSLTNQPFYQRGINAGKDEDEEAGNGRGSLRPTRVQGFESLDGLTSGSLDNVSSEMKRSAVHWMAVSAFLDLIKKIESVHNLVCKDIEDSYKLPEACSVWIKREVDRKLPFQEKHVMQQVSILGNLEDLGVIKSSLNRGKCVLVEPNVDNGTEVTAVVEFGAGRGYLTQMLADCYGITRVFLVERKSYKLKADRSLRQKENLILERLRIDIEDLNLSAVESLQGHPYLAIGKHLCGPATDLTLRCCLENQSVAGHTGDDHYLRGLAIATCCHHLCQWKSYINKKYLSSLGISREEFHAMTWLTSWAVDADHGSDLHDATDWRLNLEPGEAEGSGEDVSGVEGVIKNMKAIERAKLGFMCKQIIDMGRVMWIKECGLALATQLVKYVSSGISPENHLLIAKMNSHFSE